MTESNFSFHFSLLFVSVLQTNISSITSTICCETFSFALIGRTQSEIMRKRKKENSERIKKQIDNKTEISNEQIATIGSA